MSVTAKGTGTSAATSASSVTTTMGTGTSAATSASSEPVPIVVAIVTLSATGRRVARRLVAAWPGAEIHVHRSASRGAGDRPFASVKTLTRRLFPRVSAFIFIAPCGVAVRAVAPLLGDKRRDPAVVAIDVRGRWAVSVAGGHEGGANQRAFEAAAVLEAEPVITTTTEAEKDLIVGVGCRRGAGCDRVKAALRAALRAAKLPLRRVRLLATIALKQGERGLLAAAAELGLPIRFLSRAELAATARRDFTRRPRIEKLVGAPAVAEPAALLAGRRTKLIWRRRVFDGVTIAIAREG